MRAPGRWLAGAAAAALGGLVVSAAPASGAGTKGAAAGSPGAGAKGATGASKDGTAAPKAPASGGGGRSAAALEAVRKGEDVLAALGPLAYEIGDSPAREPAGLADSAKRAAGHFDEALALSPGLPAALLGLARAHHLWGRLSPSAHLSEAALRYDAYLSERPDDYVARMEAVKLSMWRRDHRRAVRHLEAVLAAEAAGRVGADARAILDRDYVALCDRFVDLGDLALARESLVRALAVAPGAPACLKERGKVDLYEARIARGRGDEAEAERLLAVAEATLAPLVAGALVGDMETVRVLSRVLLDRRKGASAVKVLERARDVAELADEDGTVAYYEEALGGVHYELKEWGGAMRAWERALALLAERPHKRDNVQNNLAWVLCTADDPAVYDPARAVGLAREVVEIGHWLEGGHIDTLAEAYFAVGDYPAALATIERAIGLGPMEDDAALFVERKDKYLAAMRRVVPAGRATGEIWWSHRPGKAKGEPRAKD